MTISQIKIGAYGLVVAILAGFLGYSLNVLVGEGRNLLGVLFLGSIFLSLYVLQFLFIKDFWIFIVVGIQALILGLFSQVIFWGLAIFLLFLLWAVWRGKNVMTQGLKINLSFLSQAIMPMSITAFAILTAFIYTPTFVNPDLTVKQSLVENILNPALPFLQSYVPGISLDMSVGEALRAASGSFLPSEINSLPIEQRNIVIAQSEGQILQSLGDSLGVKVSVNDSLLGVVSRVLNLQLSKIPKDYQQYLDVALGLLVFLTLKSFGFLFVYIVYLFVLVIYALLRMTNFIFIVTEKVDREIVRV